MRQVAGTMVMWSALVMAGCASHRTEAIVHPDGLWLTAAPHVVSVQPHPDVRPARAVRIDAQRSWALYRGQRLGLRVERRAGRSDLYLIDPDPEGRRPEAGLWRAGDWTVHLAFEGQPAARDVEATFTMRIGLSLGLWPVVFGAPFAP
ncbi:hypothetical protein [Rhizobacter sp. LjRoot28]|jgi:hypothetical protein|uniref:hypothetical protein n=1 Tax=Rhizobacter sp. LjRoot28 TaxID=3342309 RepID=UPI003ECC80A8